MFTRFGKLGTLVAGGLLTLGVLGFSGTTAEAGDYGYGYGKYVTYYETKYVPYTVCHTYYDHCGYPYQVHKTYYKTVSVPYKKWVAY